MAYARITSALEGSKAQPRSQEDDREPQTVESLCRRQVEQNETISDIEGVQSGNDGIRNLDERGQSKVFHRRVLSDDSGQLKVSEKYLDSPFQFLN